MEKIKNLIKITENYWFTVDSKQFTLYRKTIRAKKEFGTKNTTDEMIEAIEVIGYFMELEFMLKAAARDCTIQQTKGGEIHTIGEYLNAYQEIVTTMKNAVHTA